MVTSVRIFQRLIASSYILALFAPSTSLISQISKVPKPYPILTQAPTPPLDSASTLGTKVPISFGSLPIGQYAFRQVLFTLKKGKALVMPTNQPSDLEYKYAAAKSCTAPAASDNTVCLVLVGFTPNVAQATSTTAMFQDATGSHELDLAGTGTSVSQSQSAACRASQNIFLPTIRLTALPPGEKFPDGSEKLAQEILKDFGNPLDTNFREGQINCFYDTNNTLAFFTQFKSIYNGASGAATLTANVGSFNFNNGMQVSLGTNIQAGSGTTPATAVTGSQVPTLSATSAGQAAQNLFYGGNIYVYGLVPIVSNVLDPFTRFHFDAGVIAREGVDLQDFSGNSTTASSPTTHFDLLGRVHTMS